MTSWASDFDAIVARATAVHELHGACDGMLQHLGDAFYFVTSGRFEEAHWELFWARMCKTPPMQLKEPEAYRWRAKPKPGQVLLFQEVA